jgi:hypothetical protein
MLKTQFNENDFYFRSNFKGSSLQTGDCDLYFWFQLKLNNTCVLKENPLHYNFHYLGVQFSEFTHHNLHGCHHRGRREWAQHGV